MKDNCECRKLCVLSFGLALGVFWAVVLFIMAVFAGPTGSYGLGFVQSPIVESVEVRIHTLQSQRYSLDLHLCYDAG